jgi:hypothetical protein
MKMCKRCDVPKSLEEFVRSTNTLSGRGSLCLICDRERVRERRSDPVERHKDRVAALSYRHGHLEAQRRRDREGMRAKQAWLNTLKESPCVDCLASFPPCCMDFDHVRGGKFRGIGEMLGFTKDCILAEVNKCDLVCACCHRVRTHPSRKGVGPRRSRFYEKIDLLKSLSCVDCGGCFLPVAMDFDHVRAAKVATIGQMSSFAWERVLLEIAKCELVCANCHRLRTSARKQLKAA